MKTELETKLQELRDELELLTSMVRAERLTTTPENRQCTDEQAERTHKVLDRCIALATLPQQDVGDQPYTMVRVGGSDGTYHYRIDGPTEVAGTFTMFGAENVCRQYNAAFAACRSVPSPVGQAQQDSDVLGECHKNGTGPSGGSVASEGDPLSAAPNVPFAHSHKLTYTYLVCFGGGIGEDVWDKEATIEAENIVSAALKATDMVRDFGGAVDSITQVV